MKKTRNSKPKIDLTGQQFGYLTPFSYIKGGKWRCKCQCGNEIEVDGRNLRSGHTKSCGCLKKETKNVYDMTGYETENIKVLNREGSDNQQVALWNCLCKKCGRTFITRGSSIRAGYINSCGCVHSKNEQNISFLLENNNIEFATQYTFSDLIGINGGKLKFDFAVFKNGKLSHLIEYQGKQHYEKVPGKWGEGFETLQKHDRLKEEYCNKHNIRLIKIKYDQEYTLKDLI